MSALFCLLVCFISYPEKLDVYIPTFYKIRYILEELYVADNQIISRLIIYIDQLNTAYKILPLVIASTNPNFVNSELTRDMLEKRPSDVTKSIPKTKYTNLILDKNKNAPFPLVEISQSNVLFLKKK